MGKGIVMSKVSKRNHNSPKIDRLAAGLSRASNLEARIDVERVRSLISFYKRRGFLTKAQQDLAAGLIRRSIRQKDIVSGEADKIYLYAISNDETVKLGYSKDPKRRLKNLQTASDRPLQIVWQYYVGKTEAVAKHQERKLHRYCKAHKIRGEWFGIGCMPMVMEFHIRQERRKAVGVPAAPI